MIDQFAYEVKIGLQDRRNADLDILKADVDKQGDGAALSVSIGSSNAWLPARRSTLHHIGGDL